MWSGQFKRAQCPSSSLDGTDGVVVNFRKILKILRKILSKQDKFDLDSCCFNLVYTYQESVFQLDIVGHTFLPMLLFDEDEPRGGYKLG